jgi:protein-S-isoprenylcysteine O-methyltransferase Ste14
MTVAELKDVGRPQKLMRQIYHARGLLVSPPLIFAALCVWRETEADWLVWGLGSAFVAAGVALRVWAQAHIRFRSRPHGEHRHLATTGPYALVRNPLYIANTLICIGATFASELFWMVPVTLAWCAGLYSVVVRQEEMRLEGKYGDAWRAYAAAAPRWLPESLQTRSLGSAAGYVPRAMRVELPCVFVLAPYVVKELLSDGVLSLH